MKFALKNSLFFFCKVIVGYKNENLKSNRRLKIKKKKVTKSASFLPKKSQG